MGVNGLDKAGSSALYWSCRGQHTDIAEVLFTEPNSEQNKQDERGDVAFHANAQKVV